jgi:hypothetical protein
VLDPHKAFLADVLAQHPGLRATRLYAMLQARGYGGVMVRRYVRTIRPTRRAEAYLRLTRAPSCGRRRDRADHQAPSGAGALTWPRPCRLDYHCDNAGGATAGRFSAPGWDRASL